MEEKTSKTVTVTIPGSSRLFGLGSVVSWLLLASAWACLGVAFFCIPCAFAAAGLAVWAAATSAGSVPALAMCAGIAAACVGSELPLYYGVRLSWTYLMAWSRQMLGRGLIDAEPFRVENPGLVKASLVVMVLGCIAWGASVLMGGMDAVSLPPFVAGLLA